METPDSDERMFDYLRASGSGLPIPEQVSPEEVRRQATKRSSAIFQRLDTLHAIVDRHELTIQNRWMKKTRPQRLKIILSAWPDLPVSHRPDFDAFRKKQANARFRDSFIWPYLNQEDLTRPRSLLLLLNARARNHPSYFAAADGEAMPVGRTLQVIVPLFLNCYVVILNGISDRKADREYGRLLNWDDHPDAFDWMNTQEQFLPGEALLVLEAQERLMAFLVECCTLILHDIPEELLASNSYPIQPQPPSKSENSVTGHDSLAVMAQELPYCLPSTLSMSRIASLLSAATISAQDHVWSLREDPGYFHQAVLEQREHRQELVIDTLGKKHPIFQPHREDVFWQRIISEVISNSHIRLEYFSELLRQAQQLREMQVAVNPQLSPDKKPPEGYLDALLKFRYYLTQAAKGPLGMLKMNLIASLPFRPFFVRQPPENPNTPMIKCQSKGLQMGPVETHLLFLLQTLWEDGNNLFLLRMPLVVDELQRLIDKEPAAKNMITEFVGDVIGDLAIICECLKQIDNYQPWARGFEHLMVEKDSGIKKQYARTCQPWSGILGSLKESNPSTSRIMQLGKPTGKRFEYPVGKRRTKENTEIMRQSEANLDAFWSAVDERINKEAGDITGTAIRDLLAQPRILQRTSQWHEPDKSERKASDDGGQSALMPLSELYYNLESRTSRTLSGASKEAPSSKTKTRGQPSRTGDIAAPVPEADPPDPQPTFAVDNRALKVFRTLFFTPSLTATPGEVVWNDFVHAMASTGFGAEKLYGSVWHFTPHNLDVERSIQFHEPHPSGKIPFRIARRHGRRLYRAYGWHGAMFVLQEKLATAPDAHEGPGPGP